VVLDYGKSLSCIAHTLEIRPCGFACVLVSDANLQRVIADILRLTLDGICETLPFFRIAH